MMPPLRPNGWRVSGARGSEADEQVRCTRVLGRVTVNSRKTRLYDLVKQFASPSQLYVRRPREEDERIIRFANPPETGPELGQRRTIPWPSIFLECQPC
jgi:hypothetical protein